MKGARKYSDCHFYWYFESKAIHVQERKHSNHTNGYKIEKKNLLSAGIRCHCCSHPCGSWTDILSQHGPFQSLQLLRMCPPPTHLYCWSMGCPGGEWGKHTCPVCLSEPKLHRWHFMVPESWTQKEWTLCRMSIPQWSWKIEFWFSATYSNVLSSSRSLYRLLSSVPISGIRYSRAGRSTSPFLGTSLSRATCKNRRCICICFECFSQLRVALILLFGFYRNVRGKKIWELWSFKI